MSFNLKKRDEAYNLIALILIVAVAGGAIWYLGVFPQSVTSGFTTAYEGVKPSFQGVYWGEVAYEQGIRGTQLNFDPDDPRRGLPDLEGEMTTIFLPKDVSFGDVPSWIPQSRAIALADKSGDPVEVYEWIIDKTAYKMEEYDLKWFVSMEAGFDTYGIFDEEGNNQRWSNAEIWFKLDTSPNWIFEGADETYFTVAKIAVDYVEKDGHDKDQIDVSPESQGTAVSLFYMPYGESINVDEENFRGFAVGETHLNPEIFRNELYTMIRLDNFGTQAWWEGATRHYSSDVVTWEFTVKVFVVGQWELKDIQDASELIEGGYGRQVQIKQTGFVFDWVEFWSLELKLGVILATIAIFAGIILLIYAFATSYAKAMGRKAGGS